MSIDAVTSRIDQIMAMQQQLADPSALASSSATSSTSGGASLGATTGTTGTGSTSFSDALSSALGTDPATAALGTDPTTSALSPDSLMASAIGGTDGGSTDTSALTPDLSSLLPATNSLGLTAGSTLGGTGGAEPAQVQAMTNMANSLVGKPYVYGGGHGGWGPQSGY